MSQVVVHPDGDRLAAATAARLLLALLDAQSLRRPVHVGLTGGRIGIRVLAEVAVSPLRDLVDWSGVHFWWGDERFLPTADPERNETQARAALLDRLPLTPDQVHPVPPADVADSPEQAAVDYAAELAAFAAETDDAGPAVPAFAVLLLGVGPDGHTASLFPGQPTLEVLDRTVVGVHDAPKPPPERVSLTYPALEAAHQVWLVVSGADKADAVARALSGDERQVTPAARVTGRSRTLWLLDAEAAG